MTSTGTLLAQIIPILLQTVLRRMYAPEDFGLFGVYASIVGITTIFYSLRYAQTINIPRSDVIAANLFTLSIFISIAFTLLLSLIFFVFSDFILELVNIPKEKSSFLFFIPISSFLFSLFRVISFWLIRKKEFRLAALNKIYRRSSEGGVNLALGFSGSYFGLIIGDIVGNIVNVISGINKLARIGFSFKKVSIHKMKYSALRFKDMPKYNVIPALLNSLCLFLPAIYVNKLYGTATAGYFNLTMLVLNVPLALLGNSLSEVLTQRLAEKRYSKKQVLPEVYKLMKLLELDHC